MTRHRKNKNQHDEFHEDLAKIADFVHDRLGNVEEPTGLNNTIEEYSQHKGKDEGNNRKKN